MRAKLSSTFLATVARYNELCDTGDEDFGKRPELMSKIAQPPFDRLRMPVEVAVTVGGLTTNADSECLDEEGRVIPGLFAVGNAAGGLFGTDYNEVTVPGISIGRSLTFGWLLRPAFGEVASSDIPAPCARPLPKRRTVPGHRHPSMPSFIIGSLSHRFDNCSFLGRHVGQVVVNLAQSPLYLAGFDSVAENAFSLETSNGNA